MMRTARTAGEPFWEYTTSVFEYARHFVAANLDAAYVAAERQLERARTMTAAERAEGPFGVEVYMVRREARRIEQLRPLITGPERPEELCAAGLLALYTELDLAEPTARVLHWLVDGGLDRFENSSSWPATLAFLTEAVLYLQDEVTAGLLHPRLAEYAGLNLVAGQFIALFGSAHRYLGSVDSLLGRPNASEELESAVAMDTRMEAPLHVAHSLAARAVAPAPSRCAAPAGSGAGRPGRGGRPSRSACSACCGRTQRERPPRRGVPTVSPPARSTSSDCSPTA